MSELNREWALKELQSFLELFRSSDSGARAGTKEDILGQLHVVEQILDRVTPSWKTRKYHAMPNVLLHEGAWYMQRDATPGAITALERQKEIELNLGDGAPSLSASKLHPWVWSGARSLWQSGHYRSAVEDALKKVNAEIQNRVGRRDLSETKLFQESFSENPPQPGKPRLRRMPNDGSDTYKSLQRGAMALAEGIYAGIRNPLNHEAPADLSDQVALEYLAALSVLARWVDDATLETV